MSAHLRHFARSMPSRVSVAVLQYRLLHYRLELFELMRRELDGAGVDLILVHGQASETERLRRDEGELPWATRVTNRFWRAGGKDIVWQPLPKEARSAALLVTMQENRILSNYVHQIRRSLGGPMVAFWGHGRNFQATASSGLRERWKRLWINRVDWWFAYTELSAQLVREAGYPPDKITNLNNAIDVERFRLLLEAVEDDHIATVRNRLQIDTNSRVGLFCGSLYPEKRIDLLLESADLIRQRVPDFHLVVIGDGPSAHEIQAASRLRPWVHPVGVRTGIEKATFFRLARVLLNPGGVGLHVLDSFAAGLPLVTTADALHGPEIAYLRHRENGWVCTASDSGTYSDAVHELLMNESLSTSMAQRCLADAASYTVENMAKNFTRGILQCIGKGQLVGG